MEINVETDTFNPMDPKKCLATGDIPVVCHDKYGMEVERCRLSGVNYVQGQCFNLFSTTKLQMDGWIPGGNSEALWFTKMDSDFVVQLI
jgi:hypothetical protein